MTISIIYEKLYAINTSKCIELFTEKSHKGIQKTAEQNQEPGYLELSTHSDCKDMKINKTP